MEESGVPKPPVLSPDQRQVAEETSASAWLFRCVCVRRWLPLAYREEIYEVLHLTGPLVMSRILSFLLPFVITIFCGHIGNSELAGYALASALINVTTSATGYGLTMACDTLVSQTFGGSNLKRVGVILQRSVLILLLFCFPCWGILINAQSLLLLLQQEHEVARIAQLYVMAFLPAVPAMFLHQLQVTYLQNQGIILPQMYTAAVANIFNAATNYILIFWLDLGVEGSAAASSICWISICLLQFAYIHWKKLHVKTWGGWSRASLQEWDSYMKLAIPSTLMLCFEWWIYEIGGFLAGMLGEVDIGAQHIILELGSIIYMFPLGINAAACVRVGNALGAGDTHRALITSRVSLALSGVLALLQGFVLACTKHVIARIFTKDEEIVNLVSETLNLYIFLQFFDALTCVGSGIMLGAGKQKIAAVANLICYYCIGLPLGISLMFVAKLGIFGLYLGLFVCVILQSIFFITIIFRFNWQQITDEAQERAGKSLQLMYKGAKHPSRQPLIDSLVPNTSDGSDKTSDSSSKPDVTGPKAADSTPASIQEQDQHRPKDQNKNTELGQEKDEQEVKNQDQIKVHGLVGSSMGAVCDPEGEETDGRPQILLSTSQLVLRRGLVLLGAILALATGVAVHILCPPPEHFIQVRGNLTVDWGNFSTSSPHSSLPI